MRGFDAEASSECNYSHCASYLANRTFISLWQCLNFSVNHSAADVLREGDELLEVNGMPMWDKTTDHIVTLMVSPAKVFLIQ